MADDKMIEFAEAEVARLRAELEKTPAYKRLKAAEALISAYRGNPEVQVAQTAAPAKPTEPALTAQTKDAVEQAIEPIVTAHRTKTAQVEAAAAEYLTQRGRRATSGELLPYVQSKGIHVPGKMPSKTISSYLSTSKKFDNVPGFGGYGLVEWNGRRTAPQAQGNSDEASPASNGLFN
ncbi:hypothetical protein CIT37_19585 [Bradyrhizobium ottawaense]|uniref:HTH HARE-type domain-containing protein n=1 Tax=Bradyrhizobium ottawaense TaxID=931866 RepID=A0A2U8P8W7_9BRAD|nr:hypothetical protein [Bradyrhizobium ottawaense]AWL94117.1 hypothetical protein CIT37_19585 [Bradyrhizobium ottawaense]